LDNDWWTNCNYLASFLCPIVEVIHSTDTYSPSLGEINETFDSMLSQVKATIREKDSSLEVYTNQIQPIIQRRWDRMNAPLHCSIQNGIWQGLVEFFPLSIQRSRRDFEPPLQRFTMKKRG